VSKASFIVPLSDLEWGPKQVSFEVGEPWLRRTLEGTQAAVRSGPGRLDVELTKNGREVMVRGRVRCELSMPCVVSLEPVEVDVNAEIFLLLSPAGPRPPARGAARNAGQRAKGQSGWAKDPELSDHDAARDTYEGSEVVLDDFVREFILLELPLFPRRSDLPLSESLAIHPAPEADRSDTRVDPRLLPLAELKSRLGQK
jgi:uncharacterized metal-binding protein YceD (DUF177 family)